MTSPAAVVTLSLTQVSGLDAGAIGGATAPYFLAKVRDRVLGRSRAPTGDSFDFTTEASPWTFQGAVADGEALAISLVLYDDQGDAAATQLVTISGSIPAPWTTGTTTITGPNGETLSVDVASVTAPGSGAPAPVPRVADGTTSLATLALLDVIAIEITEVLGLYQPTGDPTNPSATVAGYASADDKGRIFLNRGYDKSWVPHQHQIEIGVTVTALSGQVPPGAKVKWTIVDVDDNTNDDPGFHKQWGPILDPNDYDSSGAPIGAHAGDNRGTRTGNPFVAVSGFALSSSTSTGAMTAIVSGASRVTFKGTNASGDNFIVRAELDGAPGATVLLAQTGIMTMWHQINVEYRKMATAFDLPVSEVPPFFEPACVQLDFLALDADPIDDVATLGDTEPQFRKTITDWVNDNFRHNGQPGWFCVMAARNAYPPPARVPEPAGGWPVATTHLWWNGTGWDHQEWFDIPGSWPGLLSAEMTWTDPTTSEDRKARFELTRATPWTKPDGTAATRCYVNSPGSHYMTHDFTATDGSLDNAYRHGIQYLPQGYVSAGGSFVSDQGYRVPHEVTAKVVGGAPFIAGISPSIKRGGKEYFAGRTVAFTHHRSFVTKDANGDPVDPPTPNDVFAEDAAIVMVHELLHAFGMPHVCGHWDYKTPRAKTCTMNYPLNWMRDITTHLLVPNSDGKSGKDMCGLHMREIRKTDLTRNDGLRWR